MTKDQLVNTLEALDVEQFKQAITLITTCRKLYIHAPSSAEGLGVLMKHRLSRFGLDIEILPKSGHELFESLMHFGARGCCFNLWVCVHEPRSKRAVGLCKKGRL